MRQKYGRFPICSSLHSLFVISNIFIIASAVVILLLVLMAWLFSPFHDKIVGLVDCLGFFFLGLLILNYVFMAMSTIAGWVLKMNHEYNSAGLGLITTMFVISTLLVVAIIGDNVGFIDNGTYYSVIYSSLEAIRIDKEK